MERICPYCMHILREETSCPNCGKAPGTYRPSPHHFPPGTRLHDRYLLGRVLGEGGFGITYLGLDTELERRVAVKEYFPTAFVKRETSLTSAVTCYTDAGRACYEKGREQFLKEARTMAKLENIPEIVRVLDFFQANNTAYIVMEFLEGETLKDRTARLGRIPSGELLDLLRPVMRAMEAMHQAGIIHRDISPDNLMCLSSGKVKLMDFGCAKDIDGGRTMTVTLKQGFAPLEQYVGHGQGPWSDLYSLCATIYYCVTGRVPPTALERDKEQDPLLPPSRLGADLTPRQELALCRGLAVRVQDRWQTMGELYGALCGVNLDGTLWQEPEEQEQQTGGKTEYVKREEAHITGDAQTGEEKSFPPEKKRISPKARGIIAACCALVVITAAALGGGLLSSPESSPDHGGSSVTLPGEETDASHSLTGEEVLLPQNEAQSAGDLLPALSDDSHEQEGETQAQDGDAGENQPSAGETGAGSSGTQPSVKPTQPQPQPTQPTQPTQQQSQSTPSAPEAPAQVTPEPDPVPTKAELESQAEAARKSGQYAQAAALYREMNGYGYVSGSKLGSILYELGLAAESAWYDSQSTDDIKTAYELYRQSADLGSAAGMYCLGCLYDNGRYVAQDQAEAVRWWEKAGAIDGDYYYWPGLYYARGWGVSQDIPKAIGYLEKCVAQGGFSSADAQALLDELQGS